MKTLALVVGGVIVVVLLAAVGGWLYLRAPDLPAAALEAKYRRPNSRYVALPGGVRLHYLDSGPADAPPVLLVHGYGDNSFGWDGWTRVLAADHRVLAVDLPGHGLTTGPADFVASPAAYADVLDAFAAALDIPHLAVAGNSLGGAVAWRLALRHPGRVDRLILVDAAGWPSATPQKDPPLAFRILRYQFGRDLLASIDNLPLIREGLKKDVVDPSVLTEDFVQRWAQLQRMPGHRPILMSRSPGAADASAAVLAPIKVPALILWGAEDRIVAVDAAHRFHAALPGSELIVYPGVGHLPQLEAAPRSAADAAAFLRRTQAR